MDDGLYYEDEYFEDNDDRKVEETCEIEKCDNDKNNSLFPLTLLKHACFRMMLTLLSNLERRTHLSLLQWGNLLMVDRTKADTIPHQFHTRVWSVT